MNMGNESGSFDATLAAAAGQDSALQAELRTAFAESASNQLDLLKRSRCDGNWNVAAMRLKRLAASFYDEVLFDLAEEALVSAPGEPVILRKIDRFLAEFATAQTRKN